MKTEPRYGLWKSHGQDFVARLNLGEKKIDKDNSDVGKLRKVQTMEVGR